MDSSARWPFGLMSFEVLAGHLQRAAPSLLFGLRLWASVCLALFIAFWLQLDNAFWAGTTAAFVCQPTLGASLRKGWYRMVGTMVGAIAIVVLTAWFPQNRIAFLLCLTLWGAICALASKIFTNFAAYAAALAGVTAAIIASDELGAVGGPDGTAFMLAISRVAEICIGIASAGVVLAVTDFGNAPRRLAASIADLAAEITHHFIDMLRHPGTDAAAIRAIRADRRDLLRRVIELDPIIDEAMGESSQLRYHSPVLQTAIDGLFAALASWHIVELVLDRLPEDEAREQAAEVRGSLPDELQSTSQDGAQWLAEPTGLRRACERAMRILIAPVARTTPSFHLVTMQTARMLGGMSRALAGLELLTDTPFRGADRGRSVELRVPDWLPPFVNAARAFLTIGAAAIFWVVTGWPSGSDAVVWTTVIVLLFGAQSDKAQAGVGSFALGFALATICAAVIEFAVLPKLETFAGLSIAIGLYLVPLGALMARSRHTALFTGMTVIFIPLLAPANETHYDIAGFCNSAVALVAGSSFGVLSFRLFAPLPPALRTRRLLLLTLQDLRRLATMADPDTLQRWEGRVHGRLSVMPVEATPLQRAELLAALSLGNAIIRLRRLCRRLDMHDDFDVSLRHFARGDSHGAIEKFARLDQLLASRYDTALTALRARGVILGISEAISQHAAYFDAGEEA